MRMNAKKKRKDPPRNNPHQGVGDAGRSTRPTYSYLVKKTITGETNRSATCRRRAVALPIPRLVPGDQSDFTGQFSCRCIHIGFGGLCTVRSINKGTGFWEIGSLTSHPAGQPRTLRALFATARSSGSFMPDFPRSRIADRFANRKMANSEISRWCLLELTFLFCELKNLGEKSVAFFDVLAHDFADLSIVWRQRHRISRAPGHSQVKHNQE
jgi:hypothetical protein